MLLQRRALNFVLKKSSSHLIAYRKTPKMAMLSTSSNQPPPPPSGQAQKSIIAVAQMRSTNDKVANMRQVEKLVLQAKSKAATFLFLPECCDFVGEHRKQTLELGEPLTGPTMQQYRALAKQHNIWLSLGGVHESIYDEGAGTSNKMDKIFNSHVLVNSQGEVVTVYRKLHLFDAVTPTFSYKESNMVAPGPQLVPAVDTPVGRLGLQICYDVRFAETSLLLRKSGAQILTYPSAFTVPTGKAGHWEVLLRARAIENQCFVVAAAQVGFHNAKRESYGHAMVVDPYGKILADCGGDDDLTLAAVEIDVATIEPVLRNMPCFEHRRGDIYSLTALSTPTVLEPPQDRRFDINVILKETIFYETEHCFAFTNLRCVVEGHVLVSTKRITPRLSQLRCDEMSDLFVTVCKIQRMLEAKYKTTSATVTVQDGTDAGQTVPHVHFHVMPRRPGDFGRNDQIYDKLEDWCDEKPERSISERIEEAQMYKEFMKSQIC